MQCRGCLKTNCENTTRLDELKIKSFNLITNLCIHEADSMPQQLCENCTKDLNLSVEFREKCITSNTILLILSAQTSNKDLKVTTQVKQEEVNDDLEREINHTKIDVKEEIEAKDEYIETHQSEDNFEYEFVSAINQQNVDDISAKTSVLKENTRKPRTKEIKKPYKKEHAFKKYDCGLCAKKIEKDELSEHVQSHENGNNDCGVCSLHFTDWETMLRHRVSHLNKPNLICHICLRSHPTQLSLECHYNVKHLGKIEDAIKCMQCNKRFFSSSNLYKHMRAVHAVKTFECKQCSKVFPTARILKNHEFKIHEKKKKCGECDFTTESLNGLRQHRLSAHAAGSVSCARCGTLFASESRLGRHSCRRTTSTVCPVCGVLFPSTDKLREHQATHSEERRYKCSRCDAAYRSWRALRVHVNKHDGVRAYKCEFCPAAFWGRPTLVKHRRVHTGERPYVCKLCNKGFTANHNLKVHMRVHGVFDLIKKKTTADEDSIDNLKECNKKSPIDKDPSRRE